MNEIFLKNGDILEKEEFNEDICVRVLKVVQKALKYDEQLLLISQTNFKRESLDTPYVVFWYGGFSINSSQNYFDSVSGIEYFCNRINAIVTVDCYGITAKKNAETIFGLIARSQEALNEQKKQRICIFQPKEILTFDLSAQEKKYERYRINLNVQYENIISIKRNAFEDIEFKLTGEK